MLSPNIETVLSVLYTLNGSHRLCMLADGEPELGTAYCMMGGNDF